MAVTDVKTKSCYYARCPNRTTWSVRTEHSMSPSGEPFHFYTCDEHCDELTNDCRKAGTRYLLRPIEPESEPPIQEQEAEEKRHRVFLGSLPWPLRVVASVAVTVIFVLIMPFIIGYFLFKFLFLDWTLPREP